MPTYEYECEKCGYCFEKFHSITAEPLKQCQKNECQGPVHRLISSGAGFLLKGTGFYQTDYRSDTYKKAADSDKNKTSSPSEKKEPSKKKTTEKKTGSAKKD